MSLYLDQTFLSRISGSLDKYEVKRNSPFLAICRCWYCGDSQKSLLKRRGYFFQKEDNILYNCKNCGITRSIRSILKESYSHFYSDYLVEQYASNKPVEIKEHQTKFEFIPKFLQENKPLRKLTKIIDLDDDHHAKQFLLNRQIPKDKFSELYYCDDFSKWVNSMAPNKLDSKYTEDRIVIPYLNKEGIFVRLTARSINKTSNIKYIHINLIEDINPLYNFYKIQFDLPVYILEGQFDSMFLSNCIAVGNGDLSTALRFIEQKYIPQCIFIPDRDIRNKEIIKNTKKLIDHGLKTCLLPKEFLGKDINEGILNGMSVSSIKNMIKNNTFVGQKALLELNLWRKC